MAARTGKQFLQGLRDGRELWVGGDKVASIADHRENRIRDRADANLERRAIVDIFLDVTRDALFGLADRVGRDLHG